MTEFRKASSAVETVEKLVAELAGDAAAVAGGATPSEAVQGRWAEVQNKLQELAPTAEKMRRRCAARAELEELKATLRGMLPGAPEESLKVAQEVVDAKGEGAAALEPILAKAIELEVVATYGVKMAEKVNDLLTRLAAAQQRLSAEVTPMLSEEVARLDAASAAAEEERRRQAEASAAAEAQRAVEAAKKPVEELMEANQQKLAAQKEAEEAAIRKQEEEAAAERLAEEARLAEEDALLRAEQDCERRLAEVGADEACAEALVSMMAAAVGDYREVVEGLQGMVGAIASEPADARLRLVRVGNEGFQQKLGRRPGVWMFLRGIGFEILTRETLPAGLPAALGMATGPPLERFLLLREPDMMNAYEEWTAWHGRLTGVAKFLQGLERLAFQRTAHLGRHGQDVKAKDALSSKEVLQGWHDALGSS